MGPILIVGAGLTGCTLAHRLAEAEVETVLVEESDSPGGLIRSEKLNGVLYEPHGSHVFHTDDHEVWELANAITPFRPYRHRVGIVVEGKLLNWPPLLSEIERLNDGARIKRDLLARRDRRIDPELRAQSANFEEWCLELMGPDLYRLFVEPYTEKQWGRAPRTLPATFAPRRVSVRWDDDPYLFPDRFQGWPAGTNGYTDLIDGLLANRDRNTLITGRGVTLEALDELVATHEPEATVLTCPLDVLTGGPFGMLEWRGIQVSSIYVPHVDYAQDTTVVNYPDPAYPFIRIHEPKHATGQRCEGTVLGFEFTGARARHYPIETERNKSLNRRYQEELRERMGPGRVFFAGRLANYAYIDMDQCMRQALDCATEVLSKIGSGAR